MRITVYCSSAPDIDAKYLDLAFDLGAAIATSGADLVWGAGQVSMMGQVAKGARSKSGKTYGVIPEKLLEKEFVDPDCTELFVVPDMRSRKAKMEELSNAFIVLPGGIGTLEEFFEIWDASHLGFHSKPITVCDPFGAFEPLREAISHLSKLRMMKPGQMDLITWCFDISTAVSSSIGSSA
jgi:uncharacterized protein (TIGR00730 family)